MRDMNAIKQDFSERGVEVVAVNVFDELEAARGVADQSGYDYRWARCDERAASRLGIRAVPALIVIDRDGRVAWRSGLLTTLRGGADLLDEAVTYKKTTPGNLPTMAIKGG